MNSSSVTSRASGEVEFYTSTAQQGAPAAQSSHTLTQIEHFLQLLNGLA